MKKHVLFLLFALLSLVLISCAGQDTDQDTEQASKGHEMKLSEDGTYYEVSGIGDCKDSHIVIPSEYKDIPVTRIGDMAFSVCDIESIVIPDTVTMIGDGAFLNCAIASIILPDTLTRIGDRAFICAINSKRSIFLIPLPTLARRHLKNVLR